VKLEVFGKPAHSANPEKGINAVYKICKLVEAIRKLPVTREPFLGEGILELTDIKSSPYPGASVVPEYCMATYDRRLLTGESKESVLAPLEKLVA
jgi:acetylornithine deacetylase/succinyl-diaminopimelate desuccinylase-like protein